MDSVHCKQVGLSATPQYHQKLTYLCWNHDPRILQIDTVRCARRRSLLGRMPQPSACSLWPAVHGFICNISIMVGRASQSCLLQAHA